MKVKYFIRGLGIGILFTALLLFVVNRNQTTTLTDEEVISKAKELGMMTADEVEDEKMDNSLDKIKESITSDEPEVTVEATEVPTAEASEAPKTSEKATVSPSKEVSASPETSKETVVSEETATEDSTKTEESKGVSITIESGMVSSSIATYLYQKGVVGSATDFNDYIVEQDIAEKIRAGDYSIPKNSSYEEIIDIIT